MTGGGSALLRASLSLESYLESAEAESKSTDWRYGVIAAQKACFAPFDKIAENAMGSSDASALRSRVLTSIGDNPNLGIDFTKRSMTQ